MKLFAWIKGWCKKEDTSTQLTHEERIERLKKAVREFDEK